MSAPLKPSGAAVVVRNLRRSYGERIVIDSLNLRIERGEFVALLGESGCGKTTLLRALSGLDPIDGGSIDGPRLPAIVFQEPRLLPWETLSRNVALGLAPGPKSHAAAQAALAEVGLGERLEDWPRRPGWSPRLSWAVLECARHDTRVVRQILALQSKHVAEYLALLSAAPRQGVLENLFRTLSFKNFCTMLGELDPRAHRHLFAVQGFRHQECVFEEFPG